MNNVIPFPKKEPSSDNLFKDRVNRIDRSLKKINTLMNSLKKISEKNSSCLDK